MILNGCPLIFLDIDGVLNNARWFHARGNERKYRFDPACCGQLSRIVKETKSKIILSSSWRTFISIKDMNALIHQCGGDGVTIIGKTPVMDGKFRADEIADFLARTPRKWPITRFVVIDDEDDGISQMLLPLVLTRFATGLTKQKANEAIKILNHVR